VAVGKEKNMKWDQIEKEWSELAGSARAHWNRLTDEEWQAIAGKKGRLVGSIQKRYGIVKEEAERQVDKWSDGLLDVVGLSRTR
jgi:uncharacterized protein YjbJ (UPF0337 family)